MIAFDSLHFKILIFQNSIPIIFKSFGIFVSNQMQIITEHVNIKVYYIDCFPICYTAIDNLMVMGIDELTSPENHCFIAFREIADLKNYVNDPLAKKYADIYFNERKEQFEIDPVSTHLIKTMSERSKKLVTAKNTKFYSVLWRYDDVISPIHHNDYLTKLCSDLSITLKELIDREVPKNVVDEKDEVYDECHQHWLRCKHLSADFYGRETDYAKLVEYLQGETDQIMVIHGAAGVGKTAILSKVASQVCFVYQHKGVILNILFT